MRCSISATAALAVAFLLLIVSVPRCTATTSVITLTPDSGIASTTITGENFTPNSTVTIEWAGTKMPTVPATVETNDDGVFTAINSVLTTVPGEYTITATDENEISALAIFTVENMTDPDIAQLQSDLELLQSTVSGWGDNIEDLFTSLSELGEDTSELNDALQSLTNQLDELFEKEETGGSLMVFAITDEGFVPLTFGFDPGSSMLMMLMLMQDGGGGFFGIQELPYEDTPILLMDSAGGLIPNATVILYLSGENAFVPITLQVPGGILMIPRTDGMIFGMVEADGYEGVSFFARMGGTTGAVELSISAPGEPAAGRVGISVSVDGGPAVDADVSVDGVHQGNTDTKGEFSVELNQGPHTILVKYLSLEQSVDVTAWEKRNTHIELQEGQVSIGDAIRGKLADEYGNPVPGASVVLGGQSSFTGADGGFELSTGGAEAGTHSVISEHRFDQAACISYASSSASIELVGATGAAWGYAVIIILIFIALGLLYRKYGRAGWLSRLKGAKRYPT